MVSRVSVRVVVVVDGGGDGVRGVGGAVRAVAPRREWRVRCARARGWVRWARWRARATRTRDDDVVVVVTRDARGR